MNTNTPTDKKTPQIRGRELFKLVNGTLPDSEISSGWTKLGKLVLSLEKRFAELKELKKR